jgi:hypothetical protein
MIFKKAGIERGADAGVVDMPRGWFRMPNSTASKSVRLT